MTPFMNFAAYRPGQYAGHLVIYERVSSGEEFTTIVLPTRYGKTDLMRGSALHLYHDQFISGALVLSPGVVLRDQVVDREKWAKFLQRYQVTIPNIRYSSLSAKHYLPHVDFAQNGEMLTSVSMQLVDNNVAFFQQWVDHRRHTTGLPVLVYIDEAHTGSEDNSWGDTVFKLVQAGARAVLLTATPIRSDKKRIPGFPCQEIDRQEARHYATRPHENPSWVYVDESAATDYIWRLVPHHMTSFREAWDEDLLAMISKFPFDVNLEEIHLDGESETGLLSMLSETKARKYMDRLCRDPKVMREGIRLFVNNLHALRKLDPAIAGIIFCGNDTIKGDEHATNAHARSLATMIAELDPSLQSVIATSAHPEDEAETRIKRFASEHDPVGDVLIVKQMAGRGIDIERLKVILDLSPIRAEAAWIQRIMRAATLYKHLPAIYITPDDVRSRTLFDRLVANQGGEISTREVGELLRSYEAQRQARTYTGVYVEGTAATDFQDTEGREGQPPVYDLVQLLIKTYPGFLNGNTHAGLAEVITNGGFTIRPPQGASMDMTMLLQQEREVATTLAKLITALRRQGRTYVQADYKVAIQQVWIEAYQAAGVPVGMALAKIPDLECLKRLNRILTQMEARERGINGTYRA